MQPLRISNATRRLAEQQDEYLALSIFDERIDGINYMTSVWEPTPAELKELNEGGAVRLSIIGDDLITGRAFQPVKITTQPAPE